MLERILVIVPTYNEATNIAQIVPAILKQDPRLEVLVVDDNSPDGTGDIAERMASTKSRVHVLHRQAKEGLGRAYIAGFRWGLERDYDALFEMDADFSHDPAFIPRFLTALEDADLVVGSRYATGVNVINWPISRLLLSLGANLYARVDHRTAAQRRNRWASSAFAGRRWRPSSSIGSGPTGTPSRSR